MASKTSNFFESYALAQERFEMHSEDLALSIARANIIVKFEWME